MRTMLGLLFLLTHASLAWADVPPIDRCDQASEHCDNGGPNGDQPGVCTPDQCSRGLPDGGVMTYECLTCVPGPDGSVDASSEDDCDCRTVAPSKERSLATLMVLVGIVALARSRRRR